MDLSNAGVTFAKFSDAVWMRWPLNDNLRIRLVSIFQITLILILCFSLFVSLYLSHAVHDQLLNFGVGDF